MVVIKAVAYADEDDVPFITLNCLDVLDKAVFRIGAVEELIELGVRLAKDCQFVRAQLGSKGASTSGTSRARSRR